VRRVTFNRSSGATVGISGTVDALGIESLAVATGTVKLAALDEPVKASIVLFSSRRPPDNLETEPDRHNFPLAAGHHRVSRPDA
jgi:hypothetical protein